MDTLERRLADDLAAGADAAELRIPERADIVAGVQRRRRQRRRRGALAGAAVLLVAAGVMSVVVADGRGRTTMSDGTSTTEATTSTSERPSTTAPTTATTSTPTTSAPSPTARVAESVPLRATGIGPFTFGTAAADQDTVVAAIAAELGPPVDTVAPHPGGCTPGSGVDLDPAWQYRAEVIWHGIVLEFAGSDPGSMLLVGYSASSWREAEPVLRMEEGPSLGDPLDTWRSAYGAALVETVRDSRTIYFTLTLGDGSVHAYEHVAEETGRNLQVIAGANCGGGD
jgi:hypothetical protein